MSEKRDTLSINALIQGKEEMAGIILVFTVSQPTGANEKN